MLVKVLYHGAMSEVEVGTILAQMRKRIGYTQERMSEALGINASYLSRIEAGHKRPSWGLLVNFAKLLRVPVTDILQAAGLIAAPAVDEGEITALVAAHPDLEAVFIFARNHPAIVPDLVRYAKFLVEQLGDEREPGSGAVGENSAAGR